MPLINNPITNKITEPIPILIKVTTNGEIFLLQFISLPTTAEVAFAKTPTNIMIKPKSIFEL